MNWYSKVLPWAAAVLVVLAALAVGVVGIRHGTFAAADSDPYGYVSEADLMARLGLT